MKRLILRALGLPAAALLAAGCSLALDFSGDCVDDDGCASLGENMACQNGLCVEGTGPVTCAEPLSNGCDDIYGPLESDTGSTIEERLAAYLANPGAFELISVHTPRGSFAVAGKEIIEAAVRVAVEDVNRSRAFADIPNNGRKLAALICDDGSGAIDGGLEAARHAIECGAKAIVATQDSEPTKQIYLQVAREAKVPIIAPGALSPVFPAVRTNGGTQANDELLWRVRVPGSTTARAAAAAIKGLNQHRDVVVFYRDGAAGELNPEGPALWDAFERELCNGAFCATASVEDYAFSQPSNLLIPEISDYLRTRGDFDLVVTLITDLSDLLSVLTGVAVVAAEEGLTPEVIQVEGARSGQAPPVFFASLANAGLNREAGIELLCRMAGVSSASNGDAYGAWLTEFGIRAKDYVGLAAGESISSLLVAPTPAYFDAVMITAYAMAAAAIGAPDGQIDTPGIIGGLKRLSDSNKEPKVPPFEWQTGLTALRTRPAANQASTMNYDGASGPVDLDQSTGDVRNQFTDLWQYTLGTAMASDFGVHTINQPLSSGDAASGDIDVHLDLLDALERTSDPVCVPYPYVHLVASEMSGEM
ncbi:MAG: amino acid ABC transporter substrate-binding protein [Myxococcales bacterium]|nr:amino acid ABC transporter substrate-binding protein [Myxococcales bacterium]